MNVAIIQARLSSTRFPEKIIQPIWNNLSAIDILIKRLEMSPAVDKIVLATTNNPKDNKLVVCMIDKYPNLLVYRGSEDDVFDRITKASELAQELFPNINTVIEVTSDCPFIDMEMLADMLCNFKYHSLDYFSNIVTRGFPIGFDIQIYKPELLYILNNKIINENHKTHGGWNIVNYSILFGDFRMRNYYAEERYFHPTWRIVLDYLEDLILLKTIMQYLDTLDFTIHDIMSFLDRFPETLNINKNCIQKIAGTDKVKEK